MKLKLSIMTLLICALMLSACAAGAETSPQPAPTAPAVIVSPAPSAEPAPTPTPTPTPTPAPTPEPTPTPTPEPVSGNDPVPGETPYIEFLGNPTQGIYKDPSYDSEKCGIIRFATGYTITEEAEDEEGNLWGRLKSGAGWVDLSDARSWDGTLPLVTADHADMAVIGQDFYHECAPDYGSDYYLLADIRVTSPVTGLCLAPLDPFSDYAPGEIFYSLSSLDSFVPLVARLSFPGDFSTIGLSLVDEDGQHRVFGISVSGRNGELVVRELTGTVSFG